MLDHRRLYASLLGLKIDGSSQEQVLGVAVTPEWIAHTGFRKPCVIKNWLAAGSTTVAGGTLPHAQHAALPKLSEIDKLAFLFQEGSTARDGPLDREVQTFDVTKQMPGPRWTFRQWCLYWKERHSVLQITPTHNGLHPDAPATHHAPSVLSPTFSHQAAAQAQSVSHASRAAEDAELDSDEEEVDSKAVQRPTTLSLPPTNMDQTTQQAGGARKSRAKDRRFMAMMCMCYAGQKPLCELFPVPAELASTDLLSVLHLSHIASQLPQRQAVAVYPAGTVIDFALRPGGASAWWHVAEGGMLYVLAPPSEHNLRLFCTWMEIRGTEHGLFLQDALEGLVKLQVCAGQSVLLPSGWLVAEVSLANSLLLGGTLLHAGSLASQLVSWEVAELCQVKPRLRFPMFRHVMWHSAVHYAKVLLGAAGLHTLRKQRLPASHAPSTVTVSAAAQASVVGGGGSLPLRAVGRVTADLTGVESRKRPTCMASLLTSDIEEEIIGESPSQPGGGKRIKLGGLSRQSGHEYRPAAMRRLVPQMAPDEEDGTRALSPAERDRTHARAGVDSASSPSRLPALAAVPIPAPRISINRIRIKLPSRATATPPVPAASPGLRTKSVRQRSSAARMSMDSDEQDSGGGTSDGSGADNGGSTSDGGSGPKGSSGEAEGDWQPKHRDEEMSSAGTEDDDEDDDMGRGSRGRANSGSDSGSEAAGSRMGKRGLRARGNKQAVRPKTRGKQVATPVLKRAVAPKEAAVVRQVLPTPADAPLQRQHRALPLSRQAAADALWQQQQKAQPASRQAAEDPPQQQRRRTVADYEAGTVWQPSTVIVGEAYSQGAGRQGGSAGFETASVGMNTTGVVLNRLQPRQQTSEAEAQQPYVIDDELLDAGEDGMPGKGDTAAPRRFPTSSAVWVTGSSRPSTTGRARRVVSSDEEVENASSAAVRRSLSNAVFPPTHTPPATTGPGPVAAPAVLHVGRLKLKLGGLQSSSRPAAAVAVPLSLPSDIMLATPSTMPVVPVSVPGAGLQTQPESMHIDTQATELGLGARAPHSIPKLTIKLPGLSKRPAVIPQSDGAADDDDVEDIVCSSTATGASPSTTAASCPAPCKIPSCTGAADSMVLVTGVFGALEQSGNAVQVDEQPLSSKPADLCGAAVRTETATAGSGADAVPKAGLAQDLSELHPHGAKPADAHAQQHAVIDTLMPDAQAHAESQAALIKQDPGQPAKLISNPDLEQRARATIPALEPVEQQGVTSIPTAEAATACVRDPEWLPPPPPLPAFPPPQPQPAGREEPVAKQPLPKQQKVVKRSVHYVPPASQVANLVPLGNARDRKRPGEPILRPGVLLSPRAQLKAGPSMTARVPLESKINPIAKAALEQLAQSAAPQTSTLGSAQAPGASPTLPVFQPFTALHAATPPPSTATPAPCSFPAAAAASAGFAAATATAPPVSQLGADSSPHATPQSLPNPMGSPQQGCKAHNSHQPTHTSHHHLLHTAPPLATLDSKQHQTPPPSVRQAGDTIMGSAENTPTMGSSEKGAPGYDGPLVSAPEPHMSVHRPLASTPGCALTSSSHMAAPQHPPQHHPSASKATTVVASKEQDSKPTTSVESKVLESKVEVAAAAPFPVPHPPPRLTDVLSRWEIEDVPFLAATLRGWLDASALPDDLPFSIRDPGLLLEQLEEAIAALPAHFGPNRQLTSDVDLPRTASAALDAHVGSHPQASKYALPACTASAAQPVHVVPKQLTPTRGDTPCVQAPTPCGGVSLLPSTQRGVGSVSVSGKAGPGVADTCTSQGHVPMAAGVRLAAMDIQSDVANVVMARPGRPEDWLRFCTEEEVPQSWRACMARSPKVSHMAMPSDTAEETGETDPLTDSLPMGAGQRSAPRVPGVMHVTAGGGSRLGEAGKNMSKTASQMRRKLGL